MGDDTELGGRLRFTPKMRIRRHAEFSAVMRKGVRLTDDRLILWIRPNGTDYTRLGLVVGRRLGGAVRRNRLRRLVREGFRLSYRRLPNGLDIACCPRLPAPTLAGVIESLEALTSRVLRRLSR